MKLTILALLACGAYAQSVFPPASSGGGAPSGSAGGDLSGTYPNPTVAAVGGKTLTLANALVTSGNFGITFTVTGPTAVTFPTSGTLATTAVAVTISTSGPVTVSAWGFFFNNSAGALTYTLPAISTIGLQYCFRNSATRTGAITVTAPASTYIDLAGALGSAAGSLVSGGALGDAACVVGIDSTHYAAYVGKGTWTGS